MPDLAALQAEMARALLSGRQGRIGAWIAPGPIAADEALAVHRNTAVSGLVNALRLSHSTVDVLVGEDFFDQAARDFVRANPPAGVWLAGYGEAFADFLDAYEPARELPYLGDVARLDFALEQVGGEVVGAGGAVLDLGPALLTLDASLRLIETLYPAALIRDAIEQDADRLADLDMRPRRHALALWRQADGVGLRTVGPASAAFLTAAIAGQDPGDALTEADLQTLKSEVFTAPFARISLKPNGET